MLLTRVIPVLLLDHDSLVKTKCFKDPRYLGDPLNAVTILNEKEVDELVLLDISATRDGREPDYNLLAGIVSQAFMPFAFGGGISRFDQIERLFHIGVEKVVVNSHNFESLSLVAKASEVYGSQSIVGALDVKKSIFGKYNVYSHSGKRREKKDPVEWAKELEAAGIGELLVTCIDRESSYMGYDLALMQAIVEAVNIPVVANGGAGCVNHFAEVKKKSGVAAVAAGSLFVYHGRHKAVLITYPSVTTLQSIFEE